MKMKRDIAEKHEDCRPATTERNEPSKQRNEWKYAVGV